ncbi:hypothetical protein LJR189_004731 [Acidovorax delafieldii]|uniref:hypothetical protein n=1 Tax=Acidovorax delafieldii TaxID=47920 RepID=UPI003ECD8D9E
MLFQKFRDDLYSMLLANTADAAVMTDKLFMALGFERAVPIKHSMVFFAEGRSHA